MNPLKYLNNTSNVYATNRILWFICIFSALTDFATCYRIDDTVNNQKVTLVPPLVRSKLVISREDANNEYLYEMAEFFLGLRLNYHPRNVRAKFDLLLTYFKEENYSRAKRNLYEHAEASIETSTANSFYIQKVKRKEKKGKNKQLSVQGINIEMMGSSKMPQNRKEYVIEYVIEENEMKLIDIKLKKDIKRDQ